MSTTIRKFALRMLCLADSAQVVKQGSQQSPRTHERVEDLSVRTKFVNTLLEISGIGIKDFGVSFFLDDLPPLISSSSSASEHCTLISSALTVS